MVMDGKQGASPREGKEVDLFSPCFPCRGPRAWIAINQKHGAKPLAAHDRCALYLGIITRVPNGFKSVLVLPYSVPWTRK